MRCPKCQGEMKEQEVLTQSGKVFVDKCARCAGIWFDPGEAEQLKDDWTSIFLDDGDPKAGRLYNEITDIECPRCLNTMKSVNDPKQPHIRYEMCADHGIFMDAGEFSDYREVTLKEAFDHIFRLSRESD